MQVLSNSPITVSVDFLPASYRDQDEQRKVQVWQLVAAGLLAVTLGIASLYQHRANRAVEKQIAALVPRYIATETDKTTLKSLEQKLQQVEATAELATYLRYPWPRSQILSALLPALPDSITLSSIRLDETGGGQVMTPSTASRDPHAENVPDVSKLQPAERDLKSFRDRYDNGQVIVTLSGVAAEPAKLHAYLGELSRRRLFIKAELMSLESVADGGPRSPGISKGVRFRARLIVRQGYGQPKGPREPASQVAGSGDAPIAPGGTR